MPILGELFKCYKDTNIFHRNLLYFKSSCVAKFMPLFEVKNKMLC